MAAAVIAAFGIAVATAVVGPLTITTPVVAQNMTGDNATIENSYILLFLFL